MALTQVQSGMLGDTTQTYGMKNRLINGDMRIDQRNAGASGTGTNNLPVDRWRFEGSQASKLTWGQNLGSVTPPAGFPYYTGFSSSSAYSLTSTDYFLFYQYIEGNNIADLGWGTSNASPITLSFKVYSSLTGTFGAALLNNAQNRSYPFTYTISQANTWTTIALTIPGDTAGTWLTNNLGGICVRFSLGTGTSYSSTAGAWTAGQYWSATGATSVVGTSGATWYITGIQLEKGSTATQFDYRSYGTELALCQRYNIRWGSPFDTTGRFNAVGYGGGGSTSGICLQYPVVMRASPTFTYSLGSGLNVNDGTAAYAASSLSAGQINTLHAGVSITQSTSVTSKGLSIYAAATDFYINLSAEL